jgi:flagellar biosynthetic protein FliR
VEHLIAYLGAVVPTFMLVMARTMGLMLQAPILSNKNLPGTVKMAMAFGIAIIVMMVLPGYPTVPDMLLAFLLMALTEFALGAMFGYSASFMFHAFQSAGELSGVQAGMSFASTLNPLLKSNVNPFGTIYFNIALIMFLMIGGHRWLIGGFVQSFKLVPMGAFMLTPEVGKYFLQISGTFLAITLQLALPACIVLFLTDLGVGYISKAAPQASNILELVQAIKPLAGLLLLLLMPNLMSMTNHMTEQSISELDTLLRLASPNHPAPGASIMKIPR